MKGSKLPGLIATGLLATLVAGCGEVSRTGRTPAQLVIVSLEGASGAQPDDFGGTMSSDVVTIVRRQVAGQQQDVSTVFGDIGRVRMRMILRDPGIPGSIASATPLNSITIDRYRVVYRRADGRNTPGVDVPFPFDSGITFTVLPDTEMTAGFALVRITAKLEAPLAALAFSDVFIQTIADITFYGRDQAGNEVNVTGSMGINFGNFGDPQ